MRTTISSLPVDLLEDKILPKVPLTSLKPMRSTCKQWNGLLRNQFFAKVVEAKKLGFMIKDSRVCTMELDLERIRNGDGFVDQPIKQLSMLDQIEVSQIYHCEGLLLCVLEDNSSLVVWNPYLGQTRWVQSMNRFDKAFDTYALGYDKNHNYKILRFCEDLEYGCGQRHEVYNFNHNSWKVLADITPEWDIWSPQRGGISLKGNAYFFVQEEGSDDEDEKMFDNVLLCFDFTKESFGDRLPLPFHSHEEEIVTLSCVREEKFAVLYNRSYESKVLEIWVTDKIEPNAVSWSKFLEVDLALVNGIIDDSKFFYGGSFFIDEEKKEAIFFKLVIYDPPTLTCHYQTAYIIKENGYFRSVNMGEAPNVGALVCSSFVPSFVQLQTKNPNKRSMDCTSIGKKVKRNKRTIHCKQCGQAGYNCRTCGKSLENLEASQSQATPMEE